MTVNRISHSSPVSPDLATHAPASGPAGAAKPSARPAISGPLAQLAPTGRAARPAASGGGPRPLGMAPQRLKIAGLPSGGKAGAARLPSPPASASASASPAPLATPAPPAASAPASTPDHDGGIAAMRASAMETIAAQNALALIQNQIAVNQAKNSVKEELGKGLKALAQ